VVLVVARSYLLKPGIDGLDRLVKVAFQLRFNCLELGHRPLLLAPYDELSIFPALPAVVREDQKREGLRLSLSPLLSVLSGEPPKLDQPRLCSCLLFRRPALIRDGGSPDGQPLRLTIRTARHNWRRVPRSA